MNEGIFKEKSLKKIPTEQKVVITFFCLYCILGPFVNFAYYMSKVGIGIEPALKNYKGSPEEQLPPQSVAFFFETMHFHLWSQAVVLLILTFLFTFVSFLNTRIKIIIILTVFFSSIGHILLPSFTRFFSDMFVYFLFIFVIILSLSLLLVPSAIIYDIWKK